MNFYKHYIGDFQRDTGHLSLTERGAYLALMHHYYATEQPMPNDHTALCRVAGAFSKAERDAVKLAMGFFEVRDGKLWHKRIEAELEKQEGRADTNRRIALEREARKRAAAGPPKQHDESTNRAPNVPGSLHDQSTNQNQNQNHSSLRSEKMEKAPPRGTRLSADWELPEDWAEWARAERPDLEPEKIAPKFRDYWTGVAGKSGTKLDWFATWRNFIRSERAPLTALRPASAEPAWRTEQRNRTAQAVPGLVAGATPQSVIDVEARNVPTLALG